MSSLHSLSFVLGGHSSVGSRASSSFAKTEGRVYCFVFECTRRRGYSFFFLGNRTDAARTTSGLADTVGAEGLEPNAILRISCLYSAHGMGGYEHRKLSYLRSLDTSPKASPFGEGLSY